MQIGKKSPQFYATKRKTISGSDDVIVSILVDGLSGVGNVFVPDRAGAYVAQLVVSDGQYDSEPSAIQILAFTTQTKTIAALQGLETRIAELDCNAFRDGDMQNLLLNKLNVVIAKVEAGKHADAENLLRNDILPKMGGAENAEGDSIVWITDFSSQRVWYQEAQGIVRRGSAGFQPAGSILQIELASR